MPHNLRFDTTTNSYRQVGTPARATDTSLETPDKELLFLAQNAPDLSASAPFTIMRKDMGVYTAVIPSLQLKGDYTSRSTRLTTADEKTIGKAIGEAYSSLAYNAAANRAYIQPVIARYLLRDKTGEIIYKSAPVLIAPETPLQAASTQFTLSGDGLRVSAETSLTAQGFTLSLVSNNSSASEASTSISQTTSAELLVSPQLHPYLPDTSPLHSFGSSSTNSRTLLVHTPGYDGSLYPAREDSRFEARVAAILSNLDTCLSSYTSERQDTLSEINTLCRLLNATAKEPDSQSRTLAEFTYPHGFTASTCVTVGDVILWGNLTSKRFNGYAPSEFTAAADSSTGAMPTAAKVTFADGSSVVTSNVLTHSATNFSPLITYPNNDARQIELHLGSKMVTLPLKAAPGGKWSYYLAPLCQPILPDTDTGIFILPTAAPTATNIPEAIGVSAASNPLHITAMTRSAGRIISIVPTALPVSSWDFARANFYAFTDSGINAVTVNTRRDSITSARIDPRIARRKEAIVVTPEGVMAIASGDLVKINSNRVTTLLRTLSADMIGWSQPFGEIWCVTADDTKALIVDVNGNKLFTRDTPPIAHIQTHPSGLFATDLTGNIWQLSTETSSIAPVHYVQTVKIKHPHRRVLRVSLPVFAENAQGDIYIRAGFLSPVSDSTREMEAVDTDKAPTLLHLDINGDLLHPIVATIPTPSRIFYTIEISLTATNTIISL